MELIVGCPAINREWIIKHWVRYIRRSVDFAGIDNCRLYLLAPESQKEMISAFQEACITYEFEHIIVRTDEGPLPDRRNWNHDRYHTMVELRNTMLEHIRAIEPDLFLSLDSDILLGEDTIQKLISHTEQFDAIGGKCWLHPSSTHIVNYANIGRAGSLKRSDHVGLVKVDVLMAIKMMTPDAYHIDYKHSDQGEDIGWSKSAREAGLLLGWDGTTVSKHCMDPTALHTLDKRVGW